ncbi:hypothetical protein D6C76_06414 [Aureobasidium pullulans]|nr:hypothetical protein D6C76_06414 [Aureobasidium pullulans]
MSDRADFLAGIAASGCGSMFGIEGDDFGSFDYPYPDPSPPAGLHGGLDYGMLDVDPVSCDEDSDSGSPSKAQQSSKSTRRTLNDSDELDGSEQSKPNKAEKAKKRAERREASIQRKYEKKLEKLKKKKKSHGKALLVHLSEESMENLSRIAREARSEFAGSPEKKFEHVKWAVTTLTAAGYAHYVHLIGVDKEMQQQLSHLERKDEPTQAITLTLAQFRMNKAERKSLYNRTPKTSLTRSQQRQLKATGTYKVPYIRPSRKERPLAFVKVSRARREKFNEMVDLSNQKVGLDQETQKQFHAWARLQLDKKWVPKYNELFPVR